VYTLTGNSSPSFYKIEIVSITGITVREITQDEMGPLAAGHHTTEYVWDGSGQNGSQLAAGMYLYRLVVKDENMKDYKRYVPYGDSAYTNEGWGKLVIVR
jgi:flagellar hook assembly protein FlgD